jgi:hypothetical protein
VSLSIRLKDLLGLETRVKKKKKRYPPTVTIRPTRPISDLRFTLTTATIIQPVSTFRV